MSTQRHFNKNYVIGKVSTFMNYRFYISSLSFFFFNFGGCFYLLLFLDINYLGYSEQLELRLYIIFTDDQ